MSKTIAIIPARGGSKRIPNKNIKEFFGKPIIAYSIEAAVQSNLFDEIMVSTDNEGIAAISIKFGAKVPFFRSEKTSDDHAVLNDVMIEVINSYKEKDIKFDFACCMLATAPLITVDNLKKGYEMLINSNFDSIRPVVRFSYPIQRALNLNAAGRLTMINPKYKNTRSQDIKPSFYDGGQFYWFKADKFMKDNKGAFQISEIESQDIDTPEDWGLAELKYKLKFNN